MSCWEYFPRVPVDRMLGLPVRITSDDMNELILLGGDTFSSGTSPVVGRMFKAKTSCDHLDMSNPELPLYSLNKRPVYLKCCRRLDIENQSKSHGHRNDKNSFNKYKYCGPYIDQPLNESLAQETICFNVDEEESQLFEICFQCTVIIDEDNVCAELNPPDIEKDILVSSFKLGHMASQGNPMNYSDSKKESFKVKLSSLENPLFNQSLLPANGDKKLFAMGRHGNNTPSDLKSPEFLSKLYNCGEQKKKYESQYNNDQFPGQSDLGIVQQECAMLDEIMKEMENSGIFHYDVMRNNSSPSGESVEQSGLLIEEIKEPPTVVEKLYWDKKEPKSDSQLKQDHSEINDKSKHQTMQGSHGGMFLSSSDVIPVVGPASGCQQGLTFSDCLHNELPDVDLNTTGETGRKFNHLSKNDSVDGKVSLFCNYGELNTVNNNTSLESSVDLTSSGTEVHESDKESKPFQSMKSGDKDTSGEMKSDISSVFDFDESGEDKGHGVVGQRSLSELGELGRLDKYDKHEAKGVVSTNDTVVLNSETLDVNTDHRLQQTLHQYSPVASKDVENKTSCEESHKYTHTVQTLDIFRSDNNMATTAVDYGQTGMVAESDILASQMLKQNVRKTRSNLENALQYSEGLEYRTDSDKRSMRERKTKSLYLPPAVVYTKVYSLTDVILTRFSWPPPFDLERKVHVTILNR